MTELWLSTNSAPLQIFADGHFHHFVDGLDERRSNWMRYVNPAHSQSEQNLAACQNGMEIYFYTVRAVPAGAELLVWYCHDFARRLHYPPSGERMMQRLSESLWCFDSFIQGSRQCVRVCKWSISLASKLRETNKNG